MKQNPSNLKTSQSVSPEKSLYIAIFENVTNLLIKIQFFITQVFDTSNLEIGAKFLIKTCKYISYVEN